MKYYELIYMGRNGPEVMGGTTASGLLHAAQEDDGEVIAGEISKEDFEQISDDDYGPPRNKQLLTVKVVNRIKIKPYCP